MVKVYFQSFSFSVGQVVVFWLCKKSSNVEGKRWASFYGAELTTSKRNHFRVKISRKGET